MMIRKTTFEVSKLPTHTYILKKLYTTLFLSTYRVNMTTTAIFQYGLSLQIKGKNPPGQQSMKPAESSAHGASQLIYLMEMS